MSRPPSLDSLRKRIAALQDEREALTTQRRSRAEIGDQLSATVDTWSTAGAADILRQLQHAAAGQPSDLLSLRAAPGGVLNVGPVLCALLGSDHVKGVILGLLASIPEGVATAERLARIKEINASLDDLETQEEQMVVESGAPRRANCRPEIVLSC